MLLTYRQVGDRLGVSRLTVRRLVDEGHLTALVLGTSGRVVRFDQAEVDAYIEARRSQARNTPAGELDDPARTA